MIVKPGTRLFYANASEDGDAVAIGEIGTHERWVEVPVRDIPQLVKRIREVVRDMREGLVELPLDQE